MSWTPRTSINLPIDRTHREDSQSTEYTNARHLGQADCVLSLIVRASDWMIARGQLRANSSLAAAAAAADGEQLIAISLIGDVARPPLALNRSTSGSGRRAPGRDSLLWGQIPKPLHL